MTEIEFKHNGILDTLTGAHAFNFFEGMLKREVALRKREKHPLVILTISIQELKQDLEIFLLNQGIKSVIRNEDFYCRASENGFWIALRSDLQGAIHVESRITMSTQKIYEQSKNRKEFDQVNIQSKKGEKKYPKLVFLTHEYHGGISSEKWIEKIDAAYFRI